MIHSDYRQAWFESAYKRADYLGCTLYRLVTPYDDADADNGYVIETTNEIDGIFTVAGVEEELDRIEREGNDNADNGNKPF